MTLSYTVFLQRIPINYKVALVSLDETTPVGQLAIVTNKNVDFIVFAVKVSGLQKNETNLLTKSEACLDKLEPKVEQLTLQ